MLLTTVLLPLAALLPFATAQAGACKAIQRDFRSCPLQKTWPLERECVRRQNTLKALMDCVRISNRGADFHVCSEPNDGLPSGREDYDEWENQGNAGTQNCMAPRQVVLEGSRDAYCQQCSVGGVLEACPMNDPSFHSCLCAHRVKTNHLLCLSKCFAQGAAAELSCRPRKRDAPHLEPPPEKIKMSKRTIASGVFNFQIDNFGRPVYANGAVGFPLPYWQRVIANGRGMQRCYVAPQSNQLWCIKWRLPEPVEPEYETGPVEKATYGEQYEEDEEAEEDDEGSVPTRTAAPSSTEVASVTLAPKVDVVPTPGTEAEPTGEPEPKADGADKSSASSYAVGLGWVLGLQALALWHHYA
jgi:hypothetical protein